MAPAAPTPTVARSHVQQQPRQKRPFRTPVCAAPIVPTLTFEPLLTFGVAGAAQIVGFPSSPPVPSALKP